MDDDQVAKFLIAVASYVVQLHERNRNRSGTGGAAAPDFDPDTVSWEDEGFSRWMGWRGPEEQEREIRRKREA